MNIRYSEISTLDLELILGEIVQVSGYEFKTECSKCGDKRQSDRHNEFGVSLYQQGWRVLDKKLVCNKCS